MGVMSLDSGAGLPGCESLLCHRLCVLEQGLYPDRASGVHSETTNGTRTHPSGLLQGLDELMFVEHQGLDALMLVEH